MARALVGLLATVIAVSAGAACAARVPPASVEDARTAVRVKTALVNDAELGIHAIEVRVSGGVARLSGSLPSEELIARALAIARDVPGVAAVQSDLRVGPPRAAAAVQASSDERPGDAGDPDLDPRTRRRLVAIGGSVAWQASSDGTLEDALAIGPVVRLGAGSGLGVAVGFGWFGAELRASALDVPIGRIRIRPIMAGVRYTMRTRASSTSLSLVAGPAINGMTSADRIGAGELALDAGNSFAWRPGVSTWFDLSGRVALNLSAGYIVTRPRLTLVSGGEVTRRHLRADTLIVRAGLAYKIF
jgi:hypothetical protein